MKALVCEMCASPNLIKKDGMYVCENCGTRYTVEEAKKLMIEGPVDVSGSTVKIDISDELANLYQVARRAKDANDNENAARYYDMILVKDPLSWEASFYAVYCNAMKCKIAEIQSAGASIANCINTVLNLIKDNVTNREEQKQAYTEVANRVINGVNILYNAATNHYSNISSQIRGKYTQEWLNNCFAAIKCAYILGDSLDLLFGFDGEANKLSVRAWKNGVARHQALIGSLADTDGNRNKVNSYVSKIRKYDTSYAAPKESKSACYVATAVYGSYDCPQVWTLRRYRDYTLAETWYGRAFIRTYYAISPTLVKWFGHTEWFKKMWKGTLDRMVNNLNAEGVENTPYKDRQW